MKKQDMIDFCKEISITEDQFYGKEEINGDLYLSYLTSIPDGFNPTVNGSLYLNSLTSIPEGFNPTVEGDLDLRYLTSIPDGFNPTVWWNLYLSNLTSIPEGFNPSVGGCLDLGSLTSIPKGFNPTVGWNLCLNSLTSIPEGFNPIVGGSLYLKFNSERVDNIPKDFIFSWKNGKYILVDGIFCKVISKKRNVFTCKKINNSKVFYIVSDGEGNYSHGDTIKEAKDDLIFKISNRDKGEYEGLNLDNILTYEEAIKCYRVITGACEFGTKDFIINKLKQKQKEYTVREIIVLTKNQYGNKSFTQFFTK